LKKNIFIKLAIEAALKAGRYIKGSLGNVKNIRYKGEINVVTEVDKKAESIIVGIIKRHFPYHGFIAEEASYGKKECCAPSEREFNWIIDPLDGTTNFVHGFPVFCVSVALEHKGRVIAGVVYDPTRDELFTATEKGGAFLNKKRIHVSKVTHLRKALLSTGFAYNVKRARNNNISNFVRAIKSSQAVRRGGSAAIDLSYVACGRYDGFWELYLNPWDTAAGFLIVNEAGGKVTKFDGSKYTIYDKEILASNSKVHSKMMKIIN